MDSNVSQNPATHIFRFHFCAILRVKVKVKFPLERAMKTQRVGRGIALLFLEPWH
jgi:hypothetical protein